MMLRRTRFAVNEVVHRDDVDDIGQAIRISDTKRCIAQNDDDPRNASTVSESNAFERKSFISDRDTAARLEQDPPVLIVKLHMCRRSVDIRKYCTEPVHRCRNVRALNKERDL